MKRHKRYYIFYFIVIALIITMLAIPLSQPVMNQREAIVVIDAGHGGFDGGAQGRLYGVKEDGLNLSRITSYNVCYTKLLRSKRRRDHALSA